MCGLFSKDDKQNPWIARGELALEKQQYNDAHSHYLHAVEMEPQNISLHLRLAHIQEYLGKYEDALKNYQKIVEISPNTSEAWKQISLLLGETGNFEQAVSAINHVQINPNDSFFLFHKCKWVMYLGKYQEAAELAKQLSSLDPKNEYYKNLYAENLMHSGQMLLAKNIYKELIEAYPNHAEKYTKLAGFCAELNNELDEALKIYEQTGQNEYLPLYHKALIEELNGKFTEAAKTYKSLQKSGVINDTQMTIRHIYTLFWSGETKEAIAELENLITNNIKSQEIWYLLGTFSFISGSLKRATECFEEVLHLNQNTPNIWQMKGIAEFFSGKYADALNSLTRADNIKNGKFGSNSLFEGENMELIEKIENPQEKIILSENTPEMAAIEAYCLAVIGRLDDADKVALSALNTYGTRSDMEILHFRLLVASGKYQASSEAYNRICDILPDDATILFEHAETEMLLGQFTNAADIYRKLIDKYPKNPIYYSRLINCITNTGDFVLAKETAENILTILPNDADTIRAAAYVSFAAGAYTDAVTYYQRVVELQPENGHAYLGLGKTYEILGQYEEAKKAFASASAYLEENVGTVFLQAMLAANCGHLEEAASLYMSIIQTYPDLHGTACELALLSTALGRYHETETAVSITVNQGTATYSLLRLGGNASMQLLKYDEAINYYIEALTLKPGDIPTTIDLGRAYVAKENYRKALEIFDSIPNEEVDTNLLMVKTQCKINLGLWKEAEDDLRIICELEPERPESLLLLAETLEHQLKYDELLDIYDTYLSLQPNNYEVFRKVISLYLMQGNYTEAINGYDLIIETEGLENETILRNMHLKSEALAALSRWNEVADLTEKILTQNPDDLNTRRLYAKALFMTGNNTAAQNEYMTLLKADKTNLEALIIYGDLLSRSGNYDKALIAFDRVIKIEPENQNAYLEYALTALKQGNPETIITALKSLLTIADKNPYVLSSLGYLSMLAGKPTESLTFLEKAETAGCADVDLYNSRALIYLHQEKYKKALEAATTATELNPENTVAWRLKAKAHTELDELEEAITCYQNAENNKIKTDKPITESDPSQYDDNPVAETEPNESELFTEDYATPINQKQTNDSKSSSVMTKEKTHTYQKSGIIGETSETRSNRRISTVDDNTFGEEKGRGGKDESRKRGLIIN